MTEVRIAHQLVANGRKKFLIPLLFEDLDHDGLDSDLKLYIDTHTYANCKNLVFMFTFNSVFCTVVDHMKLGMVVTAKGKLIENERSNW